MKQSPAIHSGFPRKRRVWSRGYGCALAIEAALFVAGLLLLSAVSSYGTPVRSQARLPHYQLCYGLRPGAVGINSISGIPIFENTLPCSIDVPEEVLRVGTTPTTSYTVVDKSVIEAPSQKGVGTGLHVTAEKTYQDVEVPYPAGTDSTGTTYFAIPYWPHYELGASATQLRRDTITVYDANGNVFPTGGAEKAQSFILPTKVRWKALANGDIKISGRLLNTCPTDSPALSRGVCPQEVVVSNTIDSRLNGTPGFVPGDSLIANAGRYYNFSVSMPAADFPLDQIRQVSLAAGFGVPPTPTKDVVSSPVFLSIERVNAGLNICPVVANPTGTPSPCSVAQLAAE